ncbi:hypothetical protein LPN04_29875 [Rugamonas sp. A1-17]|nr:hypothetical protein [Rugamonas sp. A1-17]
MQVSKTQRPQDVHPGQFDFFSESPAPTAEAGPPTTPTKNIRIKPVITVVKPSQPSIPVRDKIMGEDRFYDVFYQFSAHADRTILTKTEFDAAEALDPHQPAEEEDEGHLRLVQRMSTALLAAPDPDAVDDDQPTLSDDVIDVFTIAAKDTPSQRLAKAMFSRMLFDLAAIEPTSADVLDEAGLDLFGQTQMKNRKRDYAQLRKFDALIWMFDLSPDEPRLTFEWVCEQLGFDEDRVRRVTARSVKKDLRQLLRFLAGLVEPEHAKACQDSLSDYLNLDTWQTFEISL